MLIENIISLIVQRLLLFSRGKVPNGGKRQFGFAAVFCGLSCVKQWVAPNCLHRFSSFSNTINKYLLNTFHMQA